MVGNLQEKQTVAESVKAACVGANPHAVLPWKGHIRRLGHAFKSIVPSTRFAPADSIFLFCHHTREVEKMLATIEELDEKCKLHPNQKMLRYIDESKKSQFGKFCPMCQMMGIPDF